MEKQAVIESSPPAVHPLKCFAPWNNLEAEAGDLIEIDRTLFSHWAVYVGDGKVIHVCGENNSTCNSETNQSQIVQDTLANVAGSSLVRVNNKEVPALQRNLTALHPKLVVENAKKCLLQKVSHNVMSVTAEQFVTSCKYGSGWSDQANTIASVLKKRTRPNRHRNRSGNAKKEHGMVLRKTTFDRTLGLTGLSLQPQKGVTATVTLSENVKEHPKEPRRMADLTISSGNGAVSSSTSSSSNANNTLAPLMKGLADIFKRKVPGNKFASSQTPYK